MERWQQAGITMDGQALRVGGLNVWSYDWLRISDSPVELPHPSHPKELHKMWQYEIRGGGKTVQFAAGELSPGVWGFYVRA